MVGTGTEKVENELKKFFPEAKILRLDSDVATVRTAVSNVISSFENEEADILIGTQMIAKGHDFKNVTLVGIILADIGLNIPSFRAGERTFNLLTQAIGRAGRHDKEGKAIIQTYSPKNYIIYDASIQDYNRFFNEEMAIRKAGQYPPYTYCTLITFASENEKNVIDISHHFKDYFVAKFANINVDVIGPSEPFLVKMNGKYQRKILLKYKKYNDVYPILKEFMEQISKNSKVSISIDVDPYEDY
jgi:primosomal protein N' (replication factor Y)